ncbi:hypothetical protein P3T25_008532 [Paraburkholderia sp. GAS32]|jgi:hypothetical protein
MTCAGVARKVGKRSRLRLQHQNKNLGQSFYWLYEGQEYAKEETRMRKEISPQNYQRRQPALVKS